MKTVLLLTDFSDNARNAAEFAIALLGYESRKYVLVNVFIEPLTSASDAIPVIDVLERDSKEGLINELAFLRSKYDKLGVQLDICPEPGGLLFALDRLTEEHDVEFIVLGSHGASAKRKPLMGNNAAYIIKHFKAPMIVVPSDCRFSSPGHVLLAVDNRPYEQLTILQPLLDIIEQYASKVSVLNVQSGSSEEVTKTVEHDQVQAALKNIPHTFYREWGKKVSLGLVDFINEHNIDMICMIDRDRTFFDNLFHPSVIKKMSAKTQVPMLVLHDRKES